MVLAQVQARLFSQTPSTMRQVLAPKAAALESLKNACWPEATAFDILFSSVSSIAGALRHKSYMPRRPVSFQHGPAYSQSIAIDRHSGLGH